MSQCVRHASGLLFGVAANFADHHHGLGLRVAVKQVKGVQEVRPNNWIAAYSDRCRLTNAPGSQLMHRFVSQGP